MRQSTEDLVISKGTSSEMDGSGRKSMQIHITDEHGKVDNNNVTLIFANGDTVSWVNDTTETAYVVFHTKKHSPLNHVLFEIPGNSSSPPDAINNSVPNGKTEYGYAVLGALGVNDPKVIISR